MNIANWLAETANAKPDAPALYDGTVRYATYNEFAGKVRSLAAGLAENHDIAPGDRVAVFLHNCPAYLELLYAVWWLGAIVVPVNYKLHPREAAWIVENSGARLIFTGNGNTLDISEPDSREVGIETAAYATLFKDGEAGKHPVPVEEDDTAWIFYSSGTTGRPKGVMLTHGNLRAMSLAYALDVDQVVPNQHKIYAAPMSHGAGLYNFVFIRTGAAHVLPQSRGFDPQEITDLSRHFGETVMFAAPTMVKRLVEYARRNDYDGTGIRTIVYGGGPMYAADIEEALAVFGPRFVQIYGQAESPMTITSLRRELVADQSHPNADIRRASVGMAMACVEVRIRESGADLPAYQPGEIAVRGATVMKGYWNNPEATAGTLRDGWLHTGDIGLMDADGFVTLTDRSKDVIISGGTNIYPREVEEVLMRHPDVLEVSVVGTKDPEWGESVVAFVVPRPEQPCAMDDLDGWCRAEIAAFKRPKRYIFCDELPKNSYGKILKTELRARLT